MSHPTALRRPAKIRRRDVPEPKAPGWNLAIPPSCRLLQSAPDGIEAAIRAIGFRAPRRTPPRIKARMLATIGELVDFGTMLGRLGYVYFMHDEDAGLLKIGFTRDLPRRLRTVRSASGRDVKLLGWIIGTTADETRLHRKFSARRERGEWFRATQAVLRHVHAAINAEATPTVSVHRKYRRDDGGRA